ncbi:hypothetical protein Sjap_021563 [Stephania japonica]|uniref:Uncharacterized protein n=1 Tax=Stephania japonica TaxID=461633 RepID=A0AAP0EM73_9MAGN
MLKTLRPQRLVFNYNIQSNCLPTALPHFKNEHSINDYISSLCKKCLYNEALQAFNSLQRNIDFEIKPSTYAHLFSACSSLRSLKYGQDVHGHLRRSKLRPDVILHNHILNMYGKCGSLEDARNVFNEMFERNAVSWTSMIAGYSQNNLEKDAIDLYIRMRQSGFSPDQFTFGSAIKACTGLGDFELGRQLHASAVKFSFGFHLIVQNALVSMYTKLGLVDDAWVVFEDIVEKDLISWSSMISGFAQQGFEFESLKLFKEMILYNVHRPNEFVFGSIFAACSALLQLEYGRQIHGVSIKFGLGTEAFTGCSLCDMYAKCGYLDCARTVFNQMELRDTVLWNSIIAAFSYGGDANEAMSYFSQMRNSNFTPDEITIRCLLCAFTSSDSYCQGKQIHSYVLKKGFISDVSVCNTLLTMYAKCSDLSDVFNIFEEMKGIMDLVSWNATMTACLKHNHNNVFGLLKMMHCSDHKPDHVTLTNILGACAVVPSLDKGYQVHCYAIKTGLETEASVMNGLIDMYTKCGILINAQKLFDSYSDPDVVSWSSLIVGYAQFGYGKEALELFKTMRNRGVKPNHVTFVGVLSACSRVGLVDEGLHYYSMMEIEYRISPTREHCSCVVDLFARSGRLKEAVGFINQMAYDPDIVVWNTVLAACKTHQNAEIGRHAAESVLRLDPSNSSAHVLLCNIYASTGNWEDVARLRKLMRSTGVRKAPGQSWIEVKDGVHVFSVEDRSHPQMDEIYMVLGDLSLEMMEAGYVPYGGFEAVPC